MSTLFSTISTQYIAELNNATILLTNAFNQVLAAVKKTKQQLLALN